MTNRNRQARATDHDREDTHFGRQIGETPMPASTPEIEEFIAGLPKAELHVHHVGSASTQTVAELARRHAGSTAVPTDETALANFFTFRDFAHFVDVYTAVVDLIRDERDVWTLTYDIGRELSRQNVRYAELTLTPFGSIAKGIPAEAFCEAIEDARAHVHADFDLRLAWCFDIPGEAGLNAADITLDTALRLQPPGLISFGLGGPELGVSRSQFADHFARARAAGLHSVPHAGESSDAASIWEAVTDLKAERIGHGIRAVHDAALMSHLAEHTVPLEISLTSNVRTQCVPSYDEHPLPQLIATGVPVSINSDDPPMFGTTLNAEYGIAAQILGLDVQGIADLSRAAFTQSFLDDASKASFTNEVDRYLHSYRIKEATGPEACRTTP